MTGYTHHLDEESNVLTIAKGFINKEVYDVQIVEDNTLQAIRVVMSIQRADNLWLINIYIISFFIAGFVGLFYSPWRPRKNLKWYAIVYFLCLTVFIIWDSRAYKEIIEKVVQYSSDLIR